MLGANGGRYFMFKYMKLWSVFGPLTEKLLESPANRVSMTIDPSLLNFFMRYPGIRTVTPQVRNQFIFLLSFRKKSHSM